MRRGGGSVNAHCWNCGTDFEVSLEREYQQFREDLSEELENYAGLLATTGYTLLAEAFREAAAWVRDFDS